MKIVSISDTHSKHRELVIPEADTLICSGDITFKGELDIIYDFSNWLKELPVKNKIIVFGNHELGLSKPGIKRDKAIQYIEDSGAIYLENNSTTIDGIKFYGSPATPFFHNWEWNYHRGKDIQAIWDKIDLDINVLITHGPPYGILDEVFRAYHFPPENVGCQDLLNKIQDLKQLKLHVFGHCHGGHGTLKSNNLMFINASSCDEKYKAVNSPIVYHI